MDDRSEVPQYDENVKSLPSTPRKTYPKRGPLQQFRFVDSLAFRCFRCTVTKKSKLVTIYGDDGHRRLCNGCYGYLLSLYKIKAGAKADRDKAEQLANLLFKAVTLDDQLQAERLYRVSEERAEHLSQEVLRFVSTSEHVARQLQSGPELEWSPAVIGLCKAVELEVVNRILKPLADEVGSTNLAVDESDQDVGRVAAFCANPTRNPPELGAFAHFLQTVVHSRRRRNTSLLIGYFLQLAKEWTGSNWLLDATGFHQSLTHLTTEFRNRAAHIDELGREDYVACRDLTIGAQGIIWQLVVATQPHR